MLEVFFNTGTDDIPYTDSGSEYTEYSEGNDTLIFSAGSSEVADGEPIPSQDDLITAGIIITTPATEIIVEDYFLADVSAAILKQIHNMGNLNKRYVVACVFDDETASEPILEVYDDSDLNTITGTILGEGTPSNSYIRAITTTNALPGVDWAEDGGTTRMAGSSAGHFLYLNDQNGRLTAAADLYFNLCVIVPDTAEDGFSGTPVFVIKWLEN